MAESRCGILCGECEYRNQPGCNGCIQIAKPFWGEVCPVKKCCEDKALEHCGLCGEFSCTLLQKFAYDPQQGDEGKRIRQCAEWAEKKNGAFQYEI